MYEHLQGNSNQSLERNLQQYLNINPKLVTVGYMDLFSFFLFSFFLFLPLACLRLIPPQYSKIANFSTLLPST